MSGCEKANQFIICPLGQTFTEPSARGQSLEIHKCLKTSLFGYVIWHPVSQFPDQGSDFRPLQWKHSILTTEPPGNSQNTLVLRELMCNLTLGSKQEQVLFTLLVSTGPRATQAPRGVSLLHVSAKYSCTLLVFLKFQIIFSCHG